MITRQDVASRLTDNLHHRLSLEELVRWAEDAMMEGELDEQDVDVLRSVVGRLGLADVREFGLTWEDCEELLSRLGYHVHIEVAPAGPS